VGLSVLAAEALTAPFTEARLFGRREIAIDISRQRIGSSDYAESRQRKWRLSLALLLAFVNLLFRRVRVTRVRAVT